MISSQICFLNLSFLSPLPLHLDSRFVPNILKLLSTQALLATTGVKYDGFQRVARLFEVLQPGSNRYAASALSELVADSCMWLIRRLRTIQHILMHPHLTLWLLPVFEFLVLLQFIFIQSTCEVMWRIIKKKTTHKKNPTDDRKSDF